jgi:hypothetical protein
MPGSVYKRGSTWTADLSWKTGGRSHQDKGRVQDQERGRSRSRRASGVSLKRPLCTNQPAYLESRRVPFRLARLPAYYGTAADDDRRLPELDHHPRRRAHPGGGYDRATTRRVAWAPLGRHRPRRRHLDRSSDDRGRRSQTSYLRPQVHVLEAHPRPRPRNGGGLTSAPRLPAGVAGTGGERWVSTGLVFTGPSGEGWHPDIVSETIQRLIDRSGLPRVTMYSLRHGHVTHL